MTAVTVVAKFVNFPKEGKKFGNVKTDAGELFWATADKLRTVQRGATVDIDYEDQTWGDKDVKVIKTVATKAPPSASTAPTSNGNGHHAKDMAPWQLPNFVSNVVGQAITAGLVKSPMDVANWTKAAMAAGKEALNVQMSRPVSGGSEPPFPSESDYQ